MLNPDTVHVKTSEKCIFSHKDQTNDGQMYTHTQEDPLRQHAH